MSDGLRTGLAAKLSARAVSRAAFGCLIGAALLATAIPARAQDDDAPMDTKIMRGIMESLGMSRDGDGITYQERAPLVIPPGRDLPPPENSTAAITSNPAWPKDPDVIRRKVDRQRERESGRDSSVKIEADSRPLRPDQLNPGGSASADQRRNPSVDSATIGDRLSPSQLGTSKGLLGGIFNKDDGRDNVKFTGEQTRATLTEPPPGYQTPSPDQPYGLSGRAPPPKAFNYPLEHGTQEN